MAQKTTAIQIGLLFFLILGVFGNNANAGWLEERRWSYTFSKIKSIRYETEACC